MWTQLIIPVIFEPDHVTMIISATFQEQGCESIYEKKSEKVWNAWKYVLFNALKVWKLGFVTSNKVWNQIKIWTLTSLQEVLLILCF